MKEDSELLRDYVRNGAEESFAELVRRRLGLVYRVALRKVNGDVHLAEEVAQGVFTDLARKAADLSRRETLTGWLFTSAHFAATKAVRTAERRRRREQKAQIMMHELSSETVDTTDWDSLRPMLDDLIHGLSESDREVLLLRFFEEKDYEQIGRRLQLSANGARSRVERALEKIRVALTRRGIATTSVALAAALEAQSLGAVPVGLASTVMSAAITSAGGSGTMTVVGFLMNKALLIGAVAMIAIGFATYQAKQTHRLEAALSDVSRDRDDLRAKLQDERQHSVGAERAMQTLRRDLTEARGKQASQFAGQKEAPPIAVAASPEERAKLHQRYDSFLQRFGLTLAQRERFVDLKLAIAGAQHDLQLAVEENGALGDSPDVEALRYKATAPFWDEIHRLLGPDGSAAYGDYEGMSAYRPAAVEIFREAKIPISDAQTDRLTRLMLKNLHPIQKKPTNTSTPVRIDWNAVTQGAESFLTPEQLDVIRKGIE